MLTSSSISPSLEPHGTLPEPCTIVPLFPRSTPRTASNRPSYRTGCLGEPLPPTSHSAGRDGLTQLLHPESLVSLPHPSHHADVPRVSHGCHQSVLWRGTLHWRSVARTRKGEQVLWPSSWPSCTRGACGDVRRLYSQRPFSRPPRSALPSMGNTGPPGDRFPGSLGCSCPIQTALLCLQREENRGWLALCEEQVSKERMGHENRLSRTRYLQSPPFSFHQVFMLSLKAKVRV